MKLIIAGTSAFVGREILRQALSSPSITSVVAVSRTQVSAPEGQDIDGSKLQTVTVQDYDTYPQEARDAFRGAKACIWTIAITPEGSQTMDFATVKRICQEHTLAGLQAIYESLSPSTRFRFMYISGFGCERSRDKVPAFMPEYFWMSPQGDTENEVLAFAAAHAQVEACVAKPGLITDPANEAQTRINLEKARSMGVPDISVTEIVAAMLDQCLAGFEKEPLEHDDLVRIGREVLARRTQGNISEELEHV